MTTEQPRFVSTVILSRAIPMLEVGYASDKPLDATAKSVIQAAKSSVWDEPVQFKPGTDIGFGVPAPVRSLGVEEMWRYPGATEMVTAALHRLKGTVPDFGVPLDQVLFLDLETQNEGRQWDMPWDEFVRLGQYAWGLGPVELTTDPRVVRDAVMDAGLVIAHNGHSFDFSVLLGDKALILTQERMLFDTMAFANTVTPVPSRYTNRAGHTFYDADNPSMAMKWLSLDNLCFQLGLNGKEGDLKALATRYNPKGTKADNLDFGLIPLDDPDFLTYAVQDVESLRELTFDLWNAHPLTEYDWREQLATAINAQITRNGWTVDIPAAQARVAELKVKRDALMRGLESDYGLPTTGKMPWRTTAGKTAIMRVLADNGITPKSRPDWPKTKTGAVSLGGEALVQLTEGTPAAELGTALAEVMGQRPLAQQALDYVKSDGRVHPSMTMFQRSLRTSTTKPGLTTWSSRDPAKAVEKSYFVARPGYKLVEFDLSQADARIVAALSGDTEYAKRFAPGVDAHELTGRMVFGDSVYDSDPHYYRQISKQLGHSYAYRAGPRKLAATARVPLEVAERFVATMQQAYPRVTVWQNRVTREGEKGYIVNAWGGRLVVDPDRSWTQSSALHGQSGTRNILIDAMIRMLEYNPQIITWIKATVHDAIAFEIPESELDKIDVIQDLMECDFMGVHFSAEHGAPGDTWMEASHG